MVKVKAVASSGLAASYLAKYFVKDFLYAEKRKGLGFARSWARSRSWPVDKLQLKTTLEKGWFYVKFSKRKPLGTSNPEFLRRIAEAERRLLVRVGTDLAFVLAARQEKLGVAARLQKAMRALSE